MEILYKITNRINKKFYIGSTSHYEDRINSHTEQIIKYDIKNISKDQELYKDMRKYGVEGFEFEILFSSKDKVLISRMESRLIRNEKGNPLNYNIMQGASGRKTLYDEDIVFIRKLYSECRMEIRDAYEEYYKNIVTFRAFKKAWLGETFKEIMPEVYTEENKKWHYKKGQSRPGEQNRASKYTEEEVILIRRRRDEGERACDVFKDFKGRSSKTSFYAIWNDKNWKYLK